jgi:DNA-binding NarL/FixJ family response regulator
MLPSASVTKEIDEAFAAGADGYILKPVDLATFGAKVAAAVKA